MTYPAYEEKQWNLPLLGIVSLAGIVIPLLLHQHGPVTWIGPAVLFVVAVCFSSLTITLTENNLSWRFTVIRWSGWRIPLTEIASIEASQSNWLEGWGIKATRTGMLYNVSGTAAIRLYLKNGKTLRLGTRDPQRWLSYLQARL